MIGCSFCSFYLSLFVFLFVCFFRLFQSDQSLNFLEKDILLLLTLRPTWFPVFIWRRNRQNLFVGEKKFSVSSLMWFPNNLTIYQIGLFLLFNSKFAFTSKSRKIFSSEQNTLQIGFAIKLESVNQHYNFPKCHLTVLINQLWTTVASTILCICFSCTPGTLQSQLPICNPDFFQIKRYRFHSDWSY